MIRQWPNGGARLAPSPGQPIRNPVTNQGLAVSDWINGRPPRRPAEDQKAFNPTENSRQVQAFGQNLGSPYTDHLLFSLTIRLPHYRCLNAASINTSSLIS